MEKQNRKRTAGEKKTGFIQHLSPKKVATSGTPYYVFHIQVSPTKSDKVVCYSSQIVQQMKSFQESKSAVKLTNLKAHSDGTPIVNEQTTIQGIKTFVIEFDHQQHENITEPPASQCIDVTIEKLLEFEAFGDALYTLTGFVYIENKDMKVVMTRYGKSTVMENAKIVDQTGDVEFHIWESSCKEFTSGKGYKVTNLLLKKFLSKKYVSTTRKTVITEIPLEYEMPSIKKRGCGCLHYRTI